jgi:transcriptional regulator with XRE-family HTH domain
MAKLKRKRSVKQVQAKLFAEVRKHLPYDWADMEELANKAEVSTVTIWSWYHGRTISPRITTLTKVALALGYTLELVRINHLKVVKFPGARL